MRTYFDQSGNAMRAKYHYDELWTFYNSAKPNGTRLSGPGHYNLDIDFEDGTFRYAGAFMRLFVPGAGNVYMETGTMTVIIASFDPLQFAAVRTTGQHPFTLQNPVPELCTLLQ